MKKERRKHPRRLIPRGKMIVFDRCSQKVATLRDLSAGGMQLGYTPETSICHQWMHIDIFTEDRGRMVIADLACKTVYDISSLMENASYRGTDARTCGLRFERLAIDQEVSLKKLLRRVAAG